MTVAHESVHVDAARESWNAREEAAESMIPLIGGLYRRHGVVTSIHGRRLVNESTIGLLKAHRFARHIDGVELPVDESLAVLEGMARLDLGPAAIDVAALANGFRRDSGGDLDDYLRRQLEGIIDSASSDLPVTDVILYGFGRIGRLIARILVSHEGAGSGLRLRAVVVRGGGEADLVKRASLFRRDSVHGPFDGTISIDVESDTMTANGTTIQMIHADDPAAIDYESFGIHDAIVVDNTGRWRDEEGLGQHLRSRGVARAVLTAPGKGGVLNVVHGINERSIGDRRLVAAASCTTNAISPVLKAIDDEYGITHGHVETIHSFTNDQNLTDNFHAEARRGRAAGSNMVLAETGAAKAVGKVLPNLDGLLTGSAIRVPTPNVSLAVLTLQLQEAVTRDEINAYLRTTSLTSTLRRQIDYVESPEIVSSDILGSRFAGVVDGLATIADDTASIVVYVWYDNEFGYSCQVVRMLETMAQAHPVALPQPRRVPRLQTTA
jgi:glyceraldehyde 3-phosphate dehydrogenase